MMTLIVVMILVLVIWNRVSIFLIRERVLLLEKNVGSNGYNCNDKTEQPFPLCADEAPDGTKSFSEKRLLIVAGGNDNEKTVGVVCRRRDVPAAIPGSETLGDIGEDSQGMTPNVELTGDRKRAKPAGGRPC